MSPSIRYSIVADDKSFARTLGWALRAETWRLRMTGRERLALARTDRDHANILIYAFERVQFDDAGFADPICAAVQRDGAGVKIFLQLAAPTVHGAARDETNRKNAVIEDMARRCGAQMVLMSDLMHTGVARRLKKSGKPNLYGYLALAHAIVRAIRAQALRHTTQRHATADAPPAAQEAMAHLVWTQPSLPANLSNGYDSESIEDFLDGRVSFSGHRSWGKFALGEPIDWGQAGANLSWQSNFNGLDFLRPALAFWYDCANGRAKRQADIVEALHARQATPDDCLRRAGSIIAEFVRNNPADRPANQRAYAEGTVSRRAKVLLMYLLCCKKAAERETPVDANALQLAWQSLTHSLAMLESDEIYPTAGNHGVRQDVLFMLVGLLFPGLDYAKRYARLGMDRLERQQLKRALSSDGVWLENSFGYHCLVMNMLTALAADLRDGGAPASKPIHDVLARMWPFVEGLIKNDGWAPLIGDTAPRFMFSALAHAREELDRAKGKSDPALELRTFERAKTTYYFPDGGYFASHTARRLNDHSSTAIFFANLSTPKHKQSDDLSVLFSHGAQDLLIDGGTYNKEVSDTVRNAARFDPASHNSFRVDGAGYALRAIPGMRPAGLDGLWEGDGWAAALGHNNAYEAARVARLVIHLKSHHAVIVLDRLASKTSQAALFEQFWHVSPDFTPPAGANAAGPWTFSSKTGGKLLAAVDPGDGEVTLEHGGAGNPIAWLMLSEGNTVPTPYLRRSARLKDGIMVSLFQSCGHAGEAGVHFTLAPRDSIEIAANGVGFACRFLASQKKLECLSLEGGIQRE